MITTYKIDMPEKGPGIIEYFFKLITIFIVVTFVLWGVIMFLMSKFNLLSPNNYIISFIVSVMFAALILIIILKDIILKIKQGDIYKIEFNDNSKTLVLFLYNNYKDFLFEKTILYTDLNIKDKPQKVEIKADKKILIYKKSNLINIFNIAKSPWTIHLRIVDIVDKLKLVSNES